MMTVLEQFRSWIEKQATERNFFSGTFWFLFSSLDDVDFVRVLDFRQAAPPLIPIVDQKRTVLIHKRTGTALQATFWHLPIRYENVHILFSLEKPAQALRPMYHLLARTRGKVNLLPLGYPIVKNCSRLNPTFSLDDTYVVRGVSYPSHPNEGGADINLRPGKAGTFFARLDEEKRVLKTVRFQAPTSDQTFCEFTIGRAGYLSYHSGPFNPLLELISERLPAELTNSVRPFEQAKGHYVEFRFSEPIFNDRANYHIVVDALSRLPRTSLALLHTNPYFHAALTNYEDGGEFDIFITGHSTIHVRGQGEVSPASFLRIQNGLTEQFRDTQIGLEKREQHTLKDLIEGRV